MIFTSFIACMWWSVQLFCTARGDLCHLPFLSVMVSTAVLYGHGNEVVLQDTMHLIQRPCDQLGSLCQNWAGSQITWRPPDHHKETQNWSGMDMSPVHQVWPKPYCKAQWEGEENKADRKRGGKTTSGNGQVWSSQSPRRQWRTGKNGGNGSLSHLWCLNDSCG